MSLVEIVELWNLPLAEREARRKENMKRFLENSWDTFVGPRVQTASGAGRLGREKLNESYQDAALHALALAADIIKADPTLSNPGVAGEIEARWKLEKPKCPGRRWLVDLIAGARKDGRLLPKLPKKKPRM
jgi:hypothetical protein